MKEMWLKALEEG